MGGTGVLYPLVTGVPLPGDAGSSEPPIRTRSFVRDLLLVVATGVILYFAGPELLSVFSSWPRLTTLQPAWLVVALAAEFAHFGCTFALQRLALRTRAWGPVVTAQLSGNAVTLVVPGGAAAGAAVQYRMLSATGITPEDAVGGLTAFTFLGIGGLLALPLPALVVVGLGAPVAGSLLAAGLISTGAFLVFIGLATVALVADQPLVWLGRVITQVLTRLRPHHPPPVDLGNRLVDQRNQVRAVLGAHLREAVLLTAGRLALDLLCLYASLRATGASADPAVILVVFAVAGVIGLIPITPGGLGLVEAGLTGLLALAGVPTGRALLATLTYRLASYWLPICAGPFAYLAFRLQQRHRARPASPTNGP